MLQVTIQRLQERLKNSRLKEVLSEELTDLLAHKPPGSRTDEYITAAAVLILKELKNELIEDERESPPCRTEQLEVSPLDCETLIKGLLVGMHHDLLESHLQMVRALGSAIAERDHGTTEHNFRVTIYAVRLAEHLALEPKEIQALIKGSFLHDIGKIGIQDKTLFKPGGLTKREYDDIKRHVALGRRIVQNVRWLEDAAGIILYHHEKWDGTGYPEGRSGTEIPMTARIFSIADVFDALTSERPYKKAMNYARAHAAMSCEKSIRFDPDLLTKFFEISENLYNDVTSRSVQALEDTVLLIINRYFKFSATIDDLRESFGSIVHQRDRNDK